MTAAFRIRNEECHAQTMTRWNIGRYSARHASILQLAVAPIKNLQSLREVHRRRKDALSDYFNIIIAAFTADPGGIQSMKILLFLATGVTLAAAPPATLPDPIAPATTGKLQCYMPDVSHKTCNSLAGYKIGPDGAIQNTASVLISKSPVITMETVSPVAVKAGKVCGVVREQDIENARFATADHVLDAKQVEPLRQQMKLAFKAIFNHELCTRYVADGNGFMANATMDGQALPGGEQRVIWVAPGDHYRVAPPAE
jgi:hypothetical protein